MKSLQYFDQIQDVMIRSGQLIMQNFCGNFEIFEKNGSSIVTAVDFENELFLKQELAKIVPQAGFIAEESDNEEIPSDFMWVIDPLDGTRNFVKGIAHFCIMVTLTYKNEPIVAAIYQPVTQDLYYAEKGKGLWLNGIKRINFVDNMVATKSAIVVCSDVDMRQLKLKFKENKIQISRRYFGSAGIDALFLAVGSIDFVVFRDIAWWDVAAGILIINEAKGLVCNYEKSAVKNRYGTLKAGNKLFFQDSL